MGYKLQANCNDLKKYFRFLTNTFSSLNTVSLSVLKREERLPVASILTVGTVLRGLKRKKAEKTERKIAMIEILHGYVDGTKEELDGWVENSQLTMHLSAYKLRFLGVDPSVTDELVSKVSELFTIQMVNLYRGDDGNEETLQIGKDYHELVIQVEYLGTEGANEAVIKKCHREVSKRLMTKFNLHDESLYLHPVYKLIVAR